MNFKWMGLSKNHQGTQIEADATKLWNDKRLTLK